MKKEKIDIATIAEYSGFFTLIGVTSWYFWAILFIIIL